MLPNRRNDMARSRPITFLGSAAVVPLIALAVAACGGGGAAATAAPPPAPSKTTTAPAKTATVRIAKSSLGSILINAAGRTLYLFKADVGASSACAGACATAWPPLLAKGTPTAGPGLRASKLGTIARSGGNRQVTYNGHPLYLFINDKKPGQTTGQGVTAFGAAWFAVSPAGNQISSHRTLHGSGSSSSHPTAAAAAPAANTPPAAKAVPRPAPKPAPKPAPPLAKPAPPANNGIPQNNGGDGDSDNNGGPSDGDGNI
jgi:predicted lipoprotein with Yx(FWY)xxD motif